MNFKAKVLQFNLVFLLLLVLISFTYPSFKKFIPGLRSPDIFADIEKKPEDLRSVKKASTIPTVGNRQTLRNYLTSSSLINSAGNDIPLKQFFEKLSAIKSNPGKKIRIAFLGDSFIEGDLITGDLRARLQQEFGGSGTGFMPVTSVSAGSRTTITQGFSKNWREVNFKSDGRPASLFLSGHTFFANEQSATNFHAVKQPLLDSFTKMQVLFGKSGFAENLSLQVNGISQQFVAAQPFNTAQVDVSSRSVEISVSPSSIPLFGFSFEGENGIVLDNFSFRGISGIELERIDSAVMTSLNSARPYDLIILQYGPNLLFRPDLRDWSWYSKKMSPVLQKMKTFFPNADFLIISTGDKGFNYSGEWKTQHGVEELVDAQYVLASDHKMDFFNLYNAMGGEGKMVEWVNKNPPLANKDYTHVNRKGAAQIADYLFTAISNEFKNYQKSL